MSILAEGKGGQLTDDPRDWTKPSKAVIAAIGDRAVVICAAGPHIEFMREDVHSWEADDLGIPGDIPEGLSVFECTLAGGERDQYNGDYNECYLVGTFRKLTPAELAAVNAGRVPWHEDGWLTEKAWGERRELNRAQCGKGGCTLSPVHAGLHRGACGCLNGCKAWECPNV